MKKADIKIFNVGPIKNIEISLNKVNVFIGEQSSGKSTIAKIISFCLWVEKDVSIRQSLETYQNDKDYFINKLISFHKLKDYFSKKSEIVYESEIIKLHYKIGQLDINWKKRYDYKRIKISYIPSERSIAVLSGMEKLELANNYIKSFLFDWFDARKNFPKEQNLSLLDLNMNYYFSDINFKVEDHITDIEKSYDIMLSNASSGLQSVTPLLVMTEHLTNNIYLQEQVSSYEINQVFQNTSVFLFDELVRKKYNQKYSKNYSLDEIIEKMNNNDKDSYLSSLFDYFLQVRNNLLKTNSTSLIIEEPEQNLFPSTQKALIYYLLEQVNANNEHLLTMTTHSPYILYALNNCIMGSIVEKKLSKNEKERLQCLKSKINPQFISIYQIVKGEIVNIQKNDGLISDNFFDEQMKRIMDDFYLMLNHYS